MERGTYTRLRTLLLAAWADRLLNIEPVEGFEKPETGNDPFQSEMIAVWKYVPTGHGTHRRELLDMRIEFDLDKKRVLQIKDWLGESEGETLSIREAIYRIRSALALNTSSSRGNERD